MGRASPSISKDLCPSEGYVIVEGRGRQVERVANLDVEVMTDSTTFIELACGRIDSQIVINSGAIQWTGDAEPAERVARDLRFTM